MHSKDPEIKSNNTSVDVVHRSHFSTNILALVGSSAFTVVVGFALNIVIARLYGPEGRGSYGIVGAFWPLATTVFLFGVPIAGTQLMAEHRGSSNAYARNALTATLITMLIAVGFLPVIAFTSLSKSFRDLPSTAYWLTAISLPLMMLNTYLDAALRGLENFRQVGRVQIASRTVTLLSVVLAYVIWPRQILPMLGSTVLAELARTIQLLRATHPIFGWEILMPAFDRAKLKVVAKQGLGFYLGAVSAIFNYRADQLILAAYWSTKAVGLYGIAVTAAELLNVLNAGLSQALMPRIAGMKDEQERTILTAKACRQSILTGLVAATGIGGLAPILFPLALGNSFKGAVPLLGLLLPAVFVLGLHRIISSDFAGRGKPIVASVANMLTMVVTGICYFAFIPKWGAYGACLGTFIGYGFVAFVMITYFLHLHPISLRDLLIPTRADVLAITSRITRRLRPKAS